MAAKVLLGLLAAVAVSGSAMLYTHNTGTCPLSGACTLACPATEPCCLDTASADDAPTCCSAKGKKALCCEDSNESPATGGEAMAALTGGVGVSR